MRYLYYDQNLIKNKHKMKSSKRSISETEEYLHV